MYHSTTFDIIIDINVPGVKVLFVRGEIMHGDMPEKKLVNESKADGPRKANDCFMDAKHLGPANLLFDEFWREGEVSLMFGASGVGKSVLATQIADGLSRGSGILGFKMTAKRQKVLYVDLRYSQRQFNTRYSSDVPRNGSYRPFKFSENLYRQRPEPDEDLNEWLRKMVSENGFGIVVIDDLSAVRNTCDGTRETLALMRDLRRLNDKFGTSILVLAGAREPGRTGLVSEADMQRARVLCDAADSVFAIGKHPRSCENRYLVQTRSMNAPTVWNGTNAPVCSLTKIDGNFLGFTFDERFQPKFDEEKIDLICNVNAARKNGASLRDIADLFEISKSTVARLLKLFRPSMLDGYTLDESDYDEYDDDESEMETPNNSVDEPEVANSEVEEDEDHDQTVHPDAAIVEPPPEPLPVLETRRDILLALGMRQTYDKNEREIFVETEDDRRNPKVWYRFHAKNKHSPMNLLTRLESKGGGNIGTRVDGPICLFNTS